MRKGGMTFDERNVFEVDDDSELSTGYDQGKFFNSFYQVDSNSVFDDRSTIGHMVSRPASRFHYNAVENAIIRSLAHREPLPYGAAVRAWEFAQRRRNLRLLDIGSGTGHWIDFFVDTQFVTEAVGLEVAPNINQFLCEKYAGQANISIMNLDVGSRDLTCERLGGSFDYISAIGVMFHITDDQKWRQALNNLQSVLAPDGLIFVGGDFGWDSKNLQFHRIDEFDDWGSQRAVGATDAVFVNKRVRSLAQWHKSAAEADLSIADLVRVQADWSVQTPENDLLVLRRAD